MKTACRLTTLLRLLSTVSSPETRVEEIEPSVREPYPSELDPKPNRGGLTSPKTSRGENHSPCVPRVESHEKGSSPESHPPQRIEISPEAMGLEEELIEDLQPRGYQHQLLEKAFRQNTLLYLPTGSGKTYIAVMLIKAMLQEIEPPFEATGKRTVFMVNTVPLVEQQATYIQRFVPVSVGRYSGDRKSSAPDNELQSTESAGNNVRRRESMFQNKKDLFPTTSPHHVGFSWYISAGPLGRNTESCWTPSGPLDHSTLSSRRLTHWINVEIQFGEMDPRDRNKFL
uniref:Helicase ATP-binding domain-containing protein n=1 Tax=Timema shepardi TaxID=629360 RepID=A0A7R9ANL6_TIMSH|nr:unnamed protein product [Timema shepardi]